MTCRAGWMGAAMAAWVAVLAGCGEGVPPSAPPGRAASAVTGVAVRPWGPVGTAPIRDSAARARSAHRIVPPDVADRAAIRRLFLLAEEAFAPQAPACDPQVLPAATFEPFAAFDLPRTAIHPATAFDGTGIWYAVNLPAGDGSGNLVPWAARMACDGTMLVAPFLVADVGHNAVDPAVAVSGDAVLVVWQVDDPDKAPDNMDVWVRAFGVDGQPRSEATLLEPTSGAAPIPGTLWMPAVAPIDGGFLVAATLADAQAQRFQTLVARLGPDGAPAPGDDGPLDAFLPAREDGIGQVYPAVAVAGDGTPWVAWDREPDQGDARVVFGPLGAWGDAMAPGPMPFPDAQAVSGAAALAVAGGDSSAVLLAASVGDDDPAIRLRQVAPGIAGAADLVRDGGRRADVSPAVAVDAAGYRGLLAWYRLRSGYLADVVVQPFRNFGGVLLARGAESVLNPAGFIDKHDAIAPYPLALTAVGAGRFLVSWVERRTGEDAATEYHVMSRFVGP